MLDRWFRVCDVNQSYWHLSKAYYGRQKSVHASINICVHHFNSRLHSNSDELFQQSPKPVSNIDVSYLVIISFDMLTNLQKVLIRCTMLHLQPQRCVPRSFFMGASIPQMQSTPSRCWAAFWWSSQGYTYSTFPEQIPMDVDWWMAPHAMALQLI